MRVKMNVTKLQELAQDEELTRGELAEEVSLLSGRILEEL